MPWQAMYFPGIPSPYVRHSHCVEPGWDPWGEMFQSMWGCWDVGFFQKANYHYHYYHYYIYIHRYIYIFNLGTSDFNGASLQKLISVAKCHAFCRHVKLWFFAMDHLRSWQGWTFQRTSNDDNPLHASGCMMVFRCLETCRQHGFQNLLRRAGDNSWNLVGSREIPPGLYC